MNAYRSHPLLPFTFLLVLTVHPVISSDRNLPGEGVIRKFGSTTIRIDPRVELLAAAQLLCDDYRDFEGRPIAGGMESSYKRDVLAYFSGFKSHPVVFMTGEMSKHAFWLGHPIRAALCRGNLPGLEPRYQPDGLLLALSGGEDKLDEYFAALSDFAEQSSFENFFISQEKQYRRMIETFFSRERRNYPRDIEEFFGTRQAEYNLIFSPLYNYSGYGQRIKTSAGQFSTFVVAGPVWITSDSLPDFNWKNHNLFWHEFSHPHVNPIVEANIEKLMEPCSPLQTVTPGEVSQYGIEWEVQVADWVGEHIARAAVTCMASKYAPGQDLDELFEKERKWGYPYVAHIHAELVRFDRNRDRYPRFEDFFPEIISAFEKISAASRQGGN